MRQGIIIFADAPVAGSSAEKALVTLVQAALAADFATPFLAYGDPTSSQRLRALLGGPPPRFFPQAARTTLGERMAQAFAFLFVQDYERVALVVGGAAAGQAPAGLFAPLFARLDHEVVAIESLGQTTVIALRRADFPQVAAIFEEVRWENPGAKEAAEKVIAGVL